MSKFTWNSLTIESHPQPLDLSIQLQTNWRRSRAMRLGLHEELFNFEAMCIAHTPYTVYQNGVELEAGGLYTVDEVTFNLPLEKADLLNLPASLLVGWSKACRDQSQWMTDEHAKAFQRVGGITPHG